MQTRFPCALHRSTHFPPVQVYGNSLTETDDQEFALVANGEFIKTNALPDPPEPDDWLDLLDGTGNIEITWRTGIAIALGVLVCCGVLCSCRRCQRKRRKIARERKAMAAIANRRNANGRRPRPPGARPQAVRGPVRPSASLPSSSRYEAWRQVPAAVSRREVSGDTDSTYATAGRGGGDARISSESTAPSTPPQEMCPECGLQLSDVLQLVSHVEKQHGGRADRSKREQGRGNGGAAGDDVDIPGGVLQALGAGAPNNVPNASPARRRSSGETRRSSGETRRHSGGNSRGGEAVTDDGAPRPRPRGRSPVPDASDWQATGAAAAAAASLPSRNPERRRLQQRLADADHSWNRGRSTDAGRREGRILPSFGSGNESGRNLIRRAGSLDSMSGLSSHAGTRLSGIDEDVSMRGGESGRETGRILPRPQQFIRRTQSHANEIPVATRLTAETLRALGSSGGPTAIAVPMQFSPVTPAVAVNLEPATSPVAQATGTQKQSKARQAKQFFKQKSQDL